MGFHTYGSGIDESQLLVLVKNMAPAFVHQTVYRFPSMLWFIALFKTLQHFFHMFRFVFNLISENNTQQHCVGRYRDAVMVVYDWRPIADSTCAPT